MAAQQRRSAMFGRKVASNERRVTTLRIILYPSGRHSRAAVHTVATATGALLVFRMAPGLPSWNGVLWYAGAFVGIHVVMIPLMTAWHAALGRFESWIHGIVEEELIRFDLHTYERQLERVVTRRGDARER